MRIRSAVALGFVLLGTILPGTLFAQDYDCDSEIKFGKPTKFGWEFSPYVGWKPFTESNDAIEFQDATALGVRIGFFLSRRWGIELSVEGASGMRDEDRNIENVDALYQDLNFTFNWNTDLKNYPNRGRWVFKDRMSPYFTAGIGNASYDFDGSLREDEFTANIGIGTRIMMTRRSGLRLDGRARFIVDADIIEYPLTLGATWVMGGKALRDSDADGVLDPEDRCPATPTDCQVDCFGCALDGDGDAVCDGVDRCPDTVPGCFVDTWGCALDSDGDGVCDGLDNCPGTPQGCWVDAHGCEKDSDGDGVCDGIDRCPDTPEGCLVDRFGCPLDGDGDGVCDGRDECPGTPRGAKVDDRGCQMLKLVMADVWFEFNKAVIRDFYYPFLDEVAKSLRADNNLSIVLELEGHTDAVGTDRYNYQLAERRAKAVKEYLISKGIHPDRMIASTRGESQPIADNNTDAGRRDNRRVEMHARGPNIDRTQIRHYRVVLRNVHFDTSSHAIRPEYEDFLKEVARVMREDRFRTVLLVMKGFADRRGGDTYNKALTERRAQSVKDFLVSNGIPARRIEIEFFGNRKATGRTPAGMQNDRRVEVHSNR